MIKTAVMILVISLSGASIYPFPAKNITAANSSVIPARLIKPGKSIGLTSINEKAATVRKVLGDPAVEDAAMGKSMETWYSKGNNNNETDIFFTTNMGGHDETSRVDHIRITSPYFLSAGRIGTGTGLASIQKHFLKLKKIAFYTSPKTKRQVTIYDDTKNGIAFEIDDLVKCIAITIHKPGEKALEIYNALFPDIKLY